MVARQASRRYTANGKTLSSDSERSMAMQWLYNLYQITLASLALAVIWLVTLEDEPWVRQANLLIWGVFLVDYVARLALAPRKRRFIRGNVPDLIAVLPLDYLADLLVTMDVSGLGRLIRLARFLKMVWLLRAGLVLWRVGHNVRSILETNGLQYVLTVALGLIVLGGIGIWTLEPEVGSVGDGIWWSIVTTTTVGYGDISPRTIQGRVLAGVLMVVGIGTIGMITSSITTYFLGRRMTSNPHIVHLITELERWDKLTPRERQELAALLKALAETATEELATEGANKHPG